jgi:hypothetical protein
MKKSNPKPSSLYLLKILSIAFLHACSNEQPDPVLPALPIYYGTRIRSDIVEHRFLTWSERTAEIVLATESGLTMIDPVTKNSREFPVTQGVSSVGTVLDSTLYFVDNSSKLSALNLFTMAIKTAIVDSISVEDDRMAINAQYFAYAKHSPQGSGTMHLYDFTTGTERPLTSGMPCQFSPDGSKLLFIREEHFYSYDLQTQSVETVTKLFNTVLGAPPKTMRWLPEGIISYALSDDGFEVTNESTKHVIAQWSEWFGQRFVSQSGNKVMVLRQRCANRAADGGCSQSQMFGSVLNISTRDLKDLIYSPGLLLVDVAFIRNDTAVVYLTSSHSLYMTEIED